MKYDYLIVGAGLYGSVAAERLSSKGSSVIVIDSKNHIGGNCYTEKKNGIDVHTYGPHVFHTSDNLVWSYINEFINFMPFQLNVIANNNDKIFNLPFNMNTFHQMWGVITPEEAKDKIESQKYRGEVTNLEEFALSAVGKDIYEKLIYGYTKKQWGKEPRELPAHIIKRLPVRYTFDNNYFRDTYQGIPLGGYTLLFERLLENVTLVLEEDYFSNRNKWDNIAHQVIYTGKIDQYFDYEFGDLDYRSLKFVEEEISKESFQGTCLVNYTSDSVPFTRITEHKHFDKNCYNTESTIITKEYPQKYDKNNNIPYYPINDSKNNALYTKYKELADKSKTIFGGRLGKYKYIDMDQTIAMALKRF